MDEFIHQHWRLITTAAAMGTTKEAQYLSSALSHVDPEWLAHIDMDAIYKKTYTPPWVPKLSSPLDASNFDDFGTPSTGKKYNKYLDAKYDETWEKEFGEASN